MRNLTIERRKTFVACTAKMKVYIEDAANGDLEINQVLCRKLGEVKNGETATFPIDDEAARLFVVADKLSRNYANDYYDIPAGTEDVTLAGQNKFNPAGGNAFRFDGSDNRPEAMAHHKRSNAKGLIFLIVAVAVGIIVGNLAGDKIGSLLFSGDKDSEPKTFSAEGMQITLPDSFSEAEFDGYTVCYDSRNAAVFALREPFTLMAGLEDYSLEQYGQLVLQANNLTGKTIQTHGNVTYFDYEATGSDNQQYYYVATLHKAHDAFWLVQFTVAADEAEERLPEILTWASSVVFPI